MAADKDTYFHALLLMFGPDPNPGTPDMDLAYKNWEHDVIEFVKENPPIWANKGEGVFRIFIDWLADRGLHYTEKYEGKDDGC